MALERGGSSSGRDFRLADPAKTFCNTCLQPQAQGTTWQTFKNVFKERFKYSHTDHYHFMKLQTAKQLKGESPQTFADICRMLAQKVMRRDGDPVAQRIHRENAECMCLASFVAGLEGNPARFVRFSNPQTVSSPGDGTGGYPRRNTRKIE